MEDSKHQILELLESSGMKLPLEDQLLELHSDNRSEKLILEPRALIMVRSAENYVQIVYR